MTNDENWMHDVIVEFISANWTAFKSHCTDYGYNENEVNEIYQSIGGKEDD